MTAKPAKKDALKSFARVSGSVFGVLVLGLGFAYSRTDLYASAGEFDKFQITAVELGLLQSVEDAQKLFEVADDQNGARLVMEAKSPQFPDVENVDQNQLRSLVAKLDPKIRLLERAVNHKRMVFRQTYNPDNLFQASETYLAGWIKTLNELVRAGIRLNDPATTGRLLRLSTALTNRIDEDKTEVGLVSRLSKSQNIATYLRTILEEKGKDPVWQAIVESCLTQLDRPYDLRTSLNLRHLADIEFVKDLERSPMSFYQANASREYPAPVRYSKFLPRFYTASLARIHERYIEAIRRLPTDPYDFAAIESACAAGDEVLHRQGWSHLVLHTLDIDLTQYTLALRKEQSIRNTVVQAVALLKAKQDPAKGLPIKGRFSIDVDGNPIRLKRTESGWVVYSVWQDGNDDGGKPVVHGKGDWAIRLPS